MGEQQMIELVAAAAMCRVTWRRAYDLVLSGRLVGRKDARGRWIVTLQSARQVAKELSAVREHDHQLADSAAASR